MTDETHGPDQADKEWLKALEARFGKVGEIRHVQVGQGPTIFVFFFRNFPGKGLTTAVTCGLARANHPDWKIGRPELMVTMRSDKLDYGLAAGFFASNFYKQKRFVFGDVFKADLPLADDTEMNAFLLFAPIFLKPEQSKFDLGPKPIQLVAAYPLYDEEIELYHRVGLQRLWKTDDSWDMDNPARAPITVA